MLKDLSPLKDYRRKRRRIRKYQKRWVYTRHLGHCFLCGIFVPWKDATIDHWLPLAHGGKHSRYNFVLACTSCNKQKDNLIPADEQQPVVEMELQEIRNRFR